MCSKAKDSGHNQGQKYVVKIVVLGLKGKVAATYEKITFILISYTRDFTLSISTLILKGSNIILDVSISD